MLSTLCLTRLKLAPGQRYYSIKMSTSSQILRKSLGLAATLEILDTQLDAIFGFDKSNLRNIKNQFIC